jgi:peptidoglycan glycosyltransferase
MMSRFVIQRILLLSAIGLLVFGMAQPPEHESAWLLCLWLAAIPVAILGLGEIPLLLRVNDTQRSLQSLTIIIAIGFGMLSLQLLRNQVIWSRYLADRVVVNQGTGETSSNVRALMLSARTFRGSMSDRNNTILTDTIVGADGRTARRYPTDNPSAFTPVLGVVNSRYGVSGLEASYADYLTGDRNIIGRFVRMINAQPAKGDNLELTIDAALQQDVAAILAGRVGAGVVLDPSTGAVLAMVSTPSYNPNDLTSNLDVDRLTDQTRMDAAWQQLLNPANNQPLLNRTIQGRYPPGSTFKLVTAAIALENAGVARPDDITCPEQFEVEPGAPPVVNAIPNLMRFTGDPASLRTVIGFSCNTAFAQYALRLGAFRLLAGAEKFGFAVPDKPGEAITMTDLPTLASLIYNNDNFLDRLPGLADTGYGQGELQVTPLQMAMVAATIGNNGVLMRPYIVERVVRANGTELYKHTSFPVGRPISNRSATILRDAMRFAVTDGFGKAAQTVEGVAIGGKSGTAEYGGPNTHAWFVALAPIEKPRFAVAVLIEDGGEGSGIGASLAGQILRAAFTHMPVVTPAP